jgi:hypothetical protein
LWTILPKREYIFSLFPDLQYRADVVQLLAGKRYDENVIAAQSALMADDPKLRQLYELLSKSIHKQAENVR